jgi:putative transposase
VSQVVGYIKGKSAIHMARVYAERRRNFVGQHFWARGYFVSTVGRDEEVIREYIRHQELEDARLEQLNRKRRCSPISFETRERLAISCEKALHAFGAKLCKRLVRCPGA